MSLALSHLSLWSTVGAARLQCKDMPNVDVGWASGFSGTWKSVWGIGSIAIVESLWWGERASLCCNWNLTSSSANTSCLERLVPIFTSHMLGTTGQSSTYFLLPVTQRLMSSWQNQNSYSTLWVEPYSFFNPFYVQIGVPCLPIPTLALHKVLVLACIAQHLLVKLVGNLAICQWDEQQLVSNTDLVCATPCFAEFKDSFMYALLTLVLGWGIE